MVARLQSGPLRASPPCIHAVLVFFYDESVLVYVITNIWQTWQYVTSKDKLYWSFGVFWWLTLPETSHHIIRTFSQPYGETCREKDWDVPPTVHSNLPATEANCFDGGSSSFSQTFRSLLPQLTSDYVGAFKQKQSNHAVLKCLSSRNSDRQIFSLF